MAAADDKVKKAVAEATKATEDFKRAKEAADNSERAKKSLEATVKELQNRLEQAEEEGRKHTKKTSQKFEEKVNSFFLS